MGGEVGARLLAKRRGFEDEAPDELVARYIDQLGPQSGRGDERPARQEVGEVSSSPIERDGKPVLADDKDLVAARCHGHHIHVAADLSDVAERRVRGCRV